MNKSISKRLTKQILILMLSFSVILLLANSLLLKPLYYYSIKKEMVQGIEALMELDYLGEDADWATEMQALNSGNAYDITIEYNDQMIYSSSMEIGLRIPEEMGDERADFNYPLNNNPTKNMPPGDDRFDRHVFFKDDAINDWEEAADDIFVGNAVTVKDGIDLFVGKTTLDNGVTIYLTQGVEPVLDSVRQANVLLVSVTGVFLVVAVFVALTISKKFTKPIREMQEHVGELSRLNFGTSLDVRTDDELQSLSEDINQLSKELQQALATLTAQNRQLEKDVVSQRKFISNISHELRTPLALIKGYADEIVQGFVKNKEQERIYIGYIAEESMKMRRLMNEILELSRIESGRMELHLQQEDVRNSIQSFVDKYAGFIDEHNLKLTLELDEGSACYDTVRFEQILANYISNAGKYCDGNKEVHIQSEKLENVFRITVKNSGGPISDDVIEYIWDGFYKADEARTRTDGSYGIGLSIVKAIQELAGMEFGCRNEDGKVAFWFDVPLSCN